MKLPEYVKKAIDILISEGFQAYAVGGCVRDGLLGITPGDYDVCTNALPEQIKSSFASYRVIPTGEKHGTITVIINEPIEITTYRTEGGYSDSRHPDSVDFVSDVKEDLERRDFTVNAMAYNPQEGIVDPFGGRQDLEKGRIRCVGDPDKRFSEDALRIMRALRFASVYGFEIDPDTAGSLHKNAHLLSRVSAERLFSEMTKLLMGEHAHKVLAEYYDVIGVFVPEILPTVGFDQRNPHHHLDVWGHTLEVIRRSPRERIMRWSALLHDLGKPESYVFGSDNKGHFPRHQIYGAKIASAVLKRLKCDNATRDAVVSLIAEHDLYFDGDERDMRYVIRRLGKEVTARALEFRIYDGASQAPDTVEEKERSARRAIEIYDKVISSGLCCTVAQLDINGNDLKDLGVRPGRQIGNILELLLDAVIDGSCPNERQGLIKYAKENLLKAD